jgi:hypothetical protein
VPDEVAALEALQRRRLWVWDSDRDWLTANPDAIEVPAEAIDEGRVRVAVEASGPPARVLARPARRGRARASSTASSSRPTRCAAASVRRSCAMPPTGPEPGAPCAWT